MDFLMDHAEALLSLFAQDNPAVTQKVPSIIRNRRPLFTDEDIITIPRSQRDEFIRKFTPNTFTKESSYLIPSIQLVRSQRKNVEWFGDQIQLIPVACIHDATRVLMLELVKPTKYVDGYREGTLTYPQGHARYSSLAERFKVQNDPGTAPLWSISSVDQILRNEIFREINEEIRVDSDYFNMDLMREIGDILFRGNGACKGYPIYINKSGSTGRHIALVYDIDLTHSHTFQNYTNLIVSNEPAKHGVRIMTINDLMQLNSIDDLCVWVAKSFSIIPFLSTTFLQPFLTML